MPPSVCLERVYQRADADTILSVVLSGGESCRIRKLLWGL